MTRAAAINNAVARFDDGRFLDDLARRVAIPTESQKDRQGQPLWDYLEKEMGPALSQLGYDVQIHQNPRPAGPILVARRVEPDAHLTCLTYGHGDVVRGQDNEWREGLDPWRIVREDDRIYGRGTADNKGQHSVNIAALAAVLETRGRLGFNSTILIDTCEETGSPGLKDFAAANRDLLAADLLIGSDGPRLKADLPTLFMGSRGTINFELSVRYRDGGHHSGNWGGLLADPGIVLAHALASITGPHGEILVPEWRPEGIPDGIRQALSRIEIPEPESGPRVDRKWGEPGLSPAERVFAWNNFAVLAMICGAPERPVNAIQPWAKACCQLRFVEGMSPTEVLPALRRHLDRNGFEMVRIEQIREEAFEATRLLPDHPWVAWAVRSIRETTGQEPAILPNLGGSLPNDIFAHVLNMPTLWVPHSYPGCSQHAPNEHALASVLREGLAMMAGLFWDLGDPSAAKPESAATP